MKKINSPLNNKHRKNVFKLDSFLPLLKFFKISLYLIRLRSKSMNCVTTGARENRASV